MARACQNALSRIPKFYPAQSRLLVDLLARCDWDAPEPACQGDCFALKQYRTTVGDRMLLL